VIIVFFCLYMSVFIILCLSLKLYSHHNMQKISLALEKIPFFLVTIPLFIVLHIEKEYRGLINYEFVTNEIFQLFIAPFIILCICFLLFKRWQKRLLFCLILTLLFFFFADFKDYLFKQWPEQFISRYVFLLPCLLTIILVSFFLLRKSNSSFKKIFLFTNIVFLIFIISEVIGITLSKPGKFKHAIYNTDNIDKKYTPQPGGIKPDIYYLLFDSYTSSLTLKNDFNYDNSKMDSFLASKGFHIIPHSRSNYNFTVHSVGSTLNMCYLKKIMPYKKIYLKDYLHVLSGIHDNNLFPILEKEGYTIINHSIFDFTNYPSTIPHYNVWRLDVLYSRHNIFKKLDMEIGWMFWIRFGKFFSPNPAPQKYILAKNRHDSLAIDALDKTMLKKQSQPRFVYLHIEAPHAPYTLDSSGKMHARRQWPIPMDVEKIDYVSQLVYSNKLIAHTINSIFEKSSRPFIIILQGDHGFRFDGNVDLRYKEFSNLSAVYFPHMDYAELNDSMSNVNTFRVVLNKFFNQRFSLLKDSSIYVDY